MQSFQKHCYFELYDMCSINYCEIVSNKEKSLCLKFGNNRELLLDISEIRIQFLFIVLQTICTDAHISASCACPCMFDDPFFSACDNIFKWSYEQHVSKYMRLFRNLI